MIQYFNTNVFQEDYLDAVDENGHFYLICCIKFDENRMCL